MKLEEKYILKFKDFDITKKFGPDATDETLYVVAYEKMKEYYKDKENEQKKKELENVEGVIWGRFKQLKRWIKAAKKRDAKEEIENLSKRKNKCLIEINKIRMIMNKELYGVK